MLRLVVKIAIEDGVSIAEVLERGAMDLKLRVAYSEMMKETAENGCN